MTREEINILINYGEHNIIAHTKLGNVFAKAIKELELVENSEELGTTKKNLAVEAQEPKTDALDKVRAEISKYGSLWVEYKIEGHSDRDIEKIVKNVLKQAKQQVLEIIDKYRQEG